MSDICPNCQQPVLTTDVVCWHCGYQLPGKRPTRPPDGSPAEVAARPGGQAHEGDDSASYDFRAIAVYGLLTLVVILGLWLVLHSLGRRPILVRNAVTGISGDWVSVTDVDLHFTLSFPADWQWLDVNWRDQTDVLAQLVERQPYIGRALRPLGDPAGDVAIVAVAVGSQTLEKDELLSFVTIGQSVRLRDLTPQAALGLLAEQTQPATRGEIDTHLPGQPQARFTTFDNTAAYKCRHLFVADEGAAGYLVAACAPTTEFAVREQELNDILDSFQLLER